MLCIFCRLIGCGGESQAPAVPAEDPSSQQTETAKTDRVQDTAIDWNSLSYSYTTQELPAQVDGHGFSGGNFELATDYILDYLSNQLS